MCKSLLYLCIKRKTGRFSAVSHKKRLVFLYSAFCFASFSASRFTLRLWQIFLIAVIEIVKKAMPAAAIIRSIRENRRRTSMLFSFIASQQFAAERSTSFIADFVILISAISTWVFCLSVFAGRKNPPAKIFFADG